MIFERALLGQELILLGTIGLAMGVIYAYLRWRAQLDLLGHVWLPALLWAMFGSLDAMITLVGTWGAPWQEGNPTTRTFLYWDGRLGLVIGTFLYVLFWAAVVVGLNTLRQRLVGRSGGGWAGVVGAAQLLILYALAVGHFFGFLSWTPYFPFWPQLDFLYEHARWFFTTSPLGYDLYIGLTLGSLCTVLHLAIAAMRRRRWVEIPQVALLRGQRQGEGQG